MSVLTPEAFEQFLQNLDSDRMQAAEKYELMRQKIVKSLLWKGCAEANADALADTVLDRLAGKIAQGEQIQNMNAYTLEISRFVWLEHSRRHREEAVGDEKMPEKTIKINEDEIFDEPDLRLRCLRKCRAEVVTEQTDQILISNYYDVEAGEKLKDIRKDLAERLGLSMNTLKVKACRIRDRLERCINECVPRLGGGVTKTSVPVTNKQGGSTR